MKTLQAIILCGCILFPFQALAGDYDGSRPLICTMVDVLECAAVTGCQRTSAEAVNIPQFIKVDFKEKKLSTIETGEKQRSTIIDYLERNEGKIVMQGAENSRGWSMVISEDTGKMSATISEERFGFVIFGACMPM